MSSNFSLDLAGMCCVLMRTQSGIALGTATDGTWYNDKMHARVLYNTTYNGNHFKWSPRWTPKCQIHWTGYSINILDFFAIFKAVGHFLPLKTFSLLSSSYTSPFPYLLLVYHTLSASSQGLLLPPTLALAKYLLNKLALIIKYL